MPDEPNVPKGERGWVGYYNKNKDLLFLITSKSNSREIYYLYENKDGALVKLGKGDPATLCEKHDVYGRIRE